MTCGTLLVHLELGQPNQPILRVTADLADQFASSVIGVVACQPIQIMDVEGNYSGELVQQDREEIDRQTREAEAEFRSVLGKRAGTLEWRAAVTFAGLSDYLASQARSADLIVTGVDPNRSLVLAPRRTNMSDLVMQAGRPVLIVPHTVERLKLDRVIIAWKDTRETRRAVLDALPFLKAAGHVAVVEIAPEAELDFARSRLQDVAAWLARDGIEADSIALPSGGNDPAQLLGVLREQHADLVVAGAYGHSRLREWVLGGVTRDLLLRAQHCALVSH